MDEADKYKQRLEAIAEKRRLQEEQDRARREMEDEKLRLQQLKRKSLRDQWLMEGPPLSPTSLDSHSPRSPLWGSPMAQEIEKHTDKLQSESQRLAEEEKLKEQMEDGQTEAVNVAEAEAEKLCDVLQNGGKNAAGLEMIEDEASTEQSPADEPAAVLTNGRGDLEADISPDAPGWNNQSTANGPLMASKGDITEELAPASSLGVSEAEPGQVPNVSINEEEEEEEGTLVMRAERVIITDEGDDVPEELTAQEDQQETKQPGADQEGGQAVEEVIKPEEAPETLTQPEKSEGAEPTADGDVHDGAKTDEQVDGEQVDGDQSEEPTSVQVQSSANALEGTTVASVPVYSESALTPELEAEGAAASSPEAAEAAGKAQDGITVPGQFQEVPLADPQENQKTEAGPAEQEPLLSQAKTFNHPLTYAEPRPAAVSSETVTPTRASPGEDREAPSHKTCQCCSVM
ncbi:Paralemmin-3 [Larimichthys crocea]|uniref:Uncharacterized protein n=1 Tax=Larimichthys crocea TaxID=215358 RepID=A0ACD3RTG9_LARCR|nr:Paralemmin-3 [Larimichthys crocea]